MTDTVTAGLGAYYVGKTYASDGNANQTRTNYLPAYTRLDAMLAYDTRNYAVKLNINNLTNKMPDMDVHSYPGSSGAPYNGSNFSPYGRAYYLEARWNFGKSE